MSAIPSELKFAPSHEWLRIEANGEAVVGISQHAQELLGDMVFVELPEVNAVVTAGDECAVAESVKAASEIFAPVGGVIIAVNEDLVDSPELINDDPYGAGWILRLRIDDEAELDNLLDAEGYQNSIDED